MSTRPRALVTGASSGIGLELARVLAREGHDLLISATSVTALDHVAGELEAAHKVSVLAIAADLADPAGAARLAADALAGGPVDILVNNAGIGLFGLFTETALEDELRIVQVNVASLVALTKHCLPPMVARGRGRILNVASTAAFVPGPRMSVYYASKAFVVSFSNAIGDELRDSGVTVSALCPGPTATGFQARARLHRSRLFRGTVMEAAPVAEAGYRGMTRGDRLIVPGMTNKMVPLAARLFPRRIVTAASRRAAEEA